MLSPDQLTFHADALRRKPKPSGMVIGMATTKITITLPDTQLDEVRQRVASHQAASISGFIQQAVQKSLRNAVEFREMVDQVLAETGGPVTPKEREWARKMISPRKRSPKTAKPRKVA